MSEYIRLPVFSDTGTPIDVTNFVYDPTSQRWEHRLRVAQQMVQKYTTEIVGDDNFTSVSAPILDEKGFVGPEGSTDENETPVAVKTWKRGKTSKYPYKTIEIGGSFEIDADSVGVTITKTLLGDRSFEFKVVNGRFVVTRTA